jgi:hypothetical protein
MGKLRIARAALAIVAACSFASADAWAGTTLNLDVLFEIAPREIPPGPHPALACKLSSTKLTGTTSPPNGEQLTAGFSAKLRVFANSSRGCGRHGAISATFILASRGFPVDAVLG